MDKQKLITAIMNALTGRAGQAFNYKQVTEMIGLKSKQDRMDVQDALYDLLAAHMVEQGIAGKFKVPDPNENRLVRGTLDMTSSGFAYLVPDNKDEEPDDIFVAHQNLNKALDGDIVDVAVIKRRKGRQPEGEVINIIERKRESFVGTIQLMQNGAFVVCSPKQLAGNDIHIKYADNDQLERTEEGALVLHLRKPKLDITEGDKVVVKITDWEDGARNPEGLIIDALGHSGENNTEMHAILAEFGLPYSYPENVEKLADTIDPGITPDEVAKRIDMREVTTFTIDPRDAKDFDDALSIRRIKDGVWEVGVHIADVTHYVKPNSKIDEEGFNRATSVYLVDRTIPMLPERLSNFLCSLRQDEDKLTYSVIFQMNDDADILSSKIAKTVIRSNRRFTYEEAQELIEGGDGDFKQEILQLNALAQKLREKRFKDGSINFERIEPRFEIDENGKPLSVYFKEAKEANKLIEEFMLAANRRVAEFIGKNEIAQGKRSTVKTFVYRVHDEPNTDKYEKFAAFIRRFGYEAMPKKGEEISGAVNRILNEVKDKKEKSLVELLALRTMAKAEYTTHNIGHYGLAFQYYTHFTSPIRRYPDMMVHRLLASYIDGGRSVNADKYEEMCKHCSKREILASDAERASIKYKQVEFLRDRIGDDFDATISGVTEWGIYAEINENMCEGMIALRDLDGDNFYFDEDNYCLVGRASGRTYRLGDPIKIRIANANLEKKQLDFALAGTPLRDVEKQNLRLKEQGKPMGIDAGAVAPSRDTFGGSGSHGRKGKSHRKANGKPPKSVLRKSKANRRKGKGKGKKR